MTIVHAELVLPGAALSETVEFLCARLGFRLDAIFPADAPATAVLSGHGVRVRLAPDHVGDPGTLRLTCTDPGAVADGARELVAPNGTRIQLVAATVELEVPPLAASLTITRMDESSWTEGRAGMHYRDLIPDRQGGRFIASHIRIVEGGAVPDYVHFHKVRFQMIYCHKGWARLVYEDQGPPFVLEAGDCVLQPPEIRHQVLESSAGLEVIEIGCPAEHETFADHELALPSPVPVYRREFGGQQFVRHSHQDAPHRPWRLPGFEARDLGFGPATGNLARAQVARRMNDGVASPTPVRHAGELLFMFVLAGELTLRCDGQHAEVLRAGDSFVIPPGLWHELDQCSTDVELLELCLPGELPLDP